MSDIRTTPKAEVIQGDCVEVMRGMAAESVHAVVCDPPYLISFMGAAFDRQGDVHKDGKKMQAWHEAWAREALRVLVPGGFLLACGGDKTYHRLACAIEDAGFEVIGGFSWLYGSGMSKAGYLSYVLERKLCKKAAGKDVYISDGALMATQPPFRHPEADALWGIAGGVKPAMELIVRARKPLAGTVVQNVQCYGTGAYFVDGCRVGFQSEDDQKAAKPAGVATSKVGEGGIGARVGAANGAARTAFQANSNAAGRWPPNVLITHAQGCQRIGETTVDSDGHYPSARPNSSVSGTQFGGFMGQADLEERHTKGEVVPVYRCVDGCPAAALDQQSGAVGAAAPASSPMGVGRHDHGIYSPAALGFRTDGEGSAFYGDAGGASRFFPNLSFDEEFDGPPFYYSAKVSRSERESGCGDLPIRILARSDGAQAAQNAGADEYTGGSQGIGLNTVAKVANNHPTVKPVALCRWLIRLVTPPGGKVLDPFCGSGSMGMAALYEGVDFTGIEREPEYVEIANARIAWVAAGGKLAEKKPQKRPSKKPEAGVKGEDTPAPARKPRTRKAPVEAQPSPPAAEVEPQAATPSPPDPTPVATPAVSVPARGVNAFLARLRGD